LEFYFFWPEYKKNKLLPQDTFLVNQKTIKLLINMYLFLEKN
jgi:hypothetical protein